MSDTQQLPILGAAAYSWKFAQVSLLPTLPAYLIRSLVNGAVTAAAISGLAGGVLPLEFLGHLLGLLITVSCLAMTVRLAMKGEIEGVTGLQFGRDEVRLLLANLLYGGVVLVLGTISLALVYVVGLAIIGMSAPDSAALMNDQAAFQAYAEAFFETSSGRIMAFLMLILACAPLLYISARLVNFPAATLARKKVMIFETWSWTRDQVWRVIGAILLSAAPAFLIATVGLWISGLLTGVPIFSDAATLAEVSPVAGFAFGFLGSIFGIPMSLIGAALAVYMYRGFEPDRQVF